MTNSQVNLLVMRKIQIWENHELNVSEVEWLAGAGNSLILKFLEREIMTNRNQFHVSMSVNESLFPL